MTTLIEKDIIELIRKDEWMVDVLDTASALELPDWMVAAGFVRNKVWNHLHGYSESKHVTDIDLIYFDPSDIAESTEKEYEKKLKSSFPAAWSVKNQARMHLRNGVPPYTSSEDAMADWPETATAVGVSIRGDELIVSAPHGIEDMVNLVVRPGPRRNDTELALKRAREKRWLEIWPKLKVESVKLDS